MPILDYFAKGIEIQLFYAFCITLLLYTIPTSQHEYIYQYESSTANADLGSLSDEFQQGFNEQSKFGVVDAAALALFSGNIVIDLVLNFFTAIPSMITLLLEGIFMFIQINADLQNTIKAIVFILVSVLYVISLLNFLMNVRSQTPGVL